MSEHPLWPATRTGAGEATVTAFPVDGDRTAAAVVIFPGGAYHHLADHEGAPVARWLNSLGVAAFVARYRIAPHRHPLPLLDAARAVRWVRHHAAGIGVDPARVGVLGFSAGGHLAGLLATETGPMLPEGPHDEVDAADPRPGLAVLCYPVTALTGPAAHGGSADNLLGGEAPESLRSELSLAGRVGAAAPPTFLWHTADDAAVPVENTLQLAGALARHGVPLEVHVYPSGRHGLGLAGEEPVAADWTRRCAAFLRGRGWCP
ncbi:alpha/beta hydrolase fold domain-containing protein [Nonomuraea phyllanthi]|uniref:Alpha/beta hydrolase fold domain-containing protein n=1 Tax=Nonomuraea phyllanthi TaxID=2219224 RepID=A0A5C4WCM1_9ACTN|nr:alpha/beta hydrolase [Nonomuraea phyllanthi]KAB8193084.1 alpha/beta hydrolase fold domain-containing protein [Nonomuraea phyllanthi]QFY11054.1 alpha/beta hydrolase fold domain-containing protein [Nonomuraea phyllanthi]